MSYITQTTHRAHMGADNNFTLWVRDEAGKRDFGGNVEAPASLAVRITPSSFSRPEVLVDAESTAPGKIAFSLSESLIEQQLAPGLWTFIAKFGSEVVAQGILEVVG